MTMKKLLTVTLFIVAPLAQAQGIENDLDGNASALQASEMRPGPQSQRSKVASKRTRTAASGTAVAMRRQ